MIPNLHEPLALIQLMRWSVQTRTFCSIRYFNSQQRSKHTNKAAQSNIDFPSFLRLAHILSVCWSFLRCCTSARCTHTQETLKVTDSMHFFLALSRSFLTRTFFSFMSLCRRPWLCRKRIPSTTSRAIWSLSLRDKPAWRAPRETYLYYRHMFKLFDVVVWTQKPTNNKK